MKIRSIRFNAAMNTLLTASNMLVSLITVPYVTRVLSVEGYGNVTFAQSLSTWLSAFCLMGVATYGIRECARARDDERELVTTVLELLVIVSVCTVVVLCIFAIGIFCLPRLRQLSSLMWMFLVSTLLLSYGVEWYYQALEQYSYITARSILFKMLSLMLTFVLVRKPSDWLVYGAIVALVTCGNNIFNLFRLIRTVNWSMASPINIKRHVRPLASFACLSIASSVYLNLDSVILGFSCADNYEVGIYQLAVKIKGVMWSVLNAVLAVFIPRLSNYMATGNTAHFIVLLKKGAQLTLNISFALFGFLLVAGGPVSVFISGPSFSAATLPVQIIGAVNFFSCMSYFIGLCILTPMGMENQLAIGNMIGVPISLVLNIVLDPVLGAIGAAVSILIAEMCIFSYQFYCVRGMGSRLFPVKNTMKIILGNVIALVLGSLVRDAIGFASPFASVLACVAVYFGVLALILIIVREDMAASIVDKALQRENK